MKTDSIKIILAS